MIYDLPKPGGYLSGMIKMNSNMPDVSFNLSLVSLVHRERQLDPDDQVSRSGADFWRIPFTVGMFLVFVCSVRLLFPLFFS